MTGFSPRKGLARIAGRAGGGLRMAFERLPPDVRETVRGKRAVLRGLAQLKRNQAVLARRIARLELAGTTPAAVAAPDGPDGPDRPDRPEVVDDRFPAGIRSRICTQAQLQEPWFDAWCTALGERPRAHRKLWEHAYIARVLDAHGHLAPGQQGLGFGVGREPLTALFAGRGCSIVATDLAHDAEGARVWSNTGQHAGGLAGLSRPELCDTDAFEKLVTWRPVDMRALPDDLSGFDFCWSACSLEHLGTLEAGLAFVEGSMQTLRPGGLAVHTTEYNLDSDTDTVVGREHRPLPESRPGSAGPPSRRAGPRGRRPRPRARRRDPRRVRRPPALRRGFAPAGLVREVLDDLGGARHPGGRAVRRVGGASGQVRSATRAAA